MSPGPSARIRSALSGLSKSRHLPAYLFDCVALAGLALLVWGLGLVYFPLTPIVSGAGLLTLGLVGAKRWPAS